MKKALCLFFISMGLLSGVSHAQKAAIMADTLGSASTATEKVFSIKGSLPPTGKPIYLHTQLEAITMRGRTASTDGAWLSVQYTLNGLEGEALLKLAEEFHAKVAKAFESSGYQLISHDEIKKAANDAGFVSKPPVQALTGNSINAILVTPHGLPAISYSLAMYADGLMPNSGIGVLDAVKAIGTVGSAISEASALASVGAKLGNPPTVRVSLALDFAELSSKRSGWFSGPQTVETKTNLRLAINEHTGIDFSSDGQSNFGRISINSPLGFTGDFVREVRDESSVGKNIAMNLPGLLTGRGASRKIVEKVAETDIDVYSKVARPALDYYVEALTPMLKAGK